MDYQAKFRDQIQKPTTFTRHFVVPRGRYGQRLWVTQAILTFRPFPYRSCLCPCQPGGRCAGSRTV